MDPPPLPPHPPTISTTTAAATAATTTTTQVSCPDSANSSPHSRHADAWDEPLPPVPGAKLRFMCSYGGHIIPRPHDKSLCYVGGDTRMVVVDRHSSLSDFSSRLSRTLLNGRQFTLKYQLPNEDLDSLISVTTDEDLENLIEEYERITSTSPLKPARLRLFLFLAKPETAASMGSLLDDAKSETWFVDALNGAALLPRGPSDSAVMECLLELDGVVHSQSCSDLEAQNEFPGTNKQMKNVHDVHSTMPDSPMMETNSSFGSSSSSPSMSNLPPIKVRAEDGGARLQDQMVGLDEHFSHMAVAPCVQKQDEGFVPLSALPPLSTVAGAATAVLAVGVSSVVVSSEHGSRVVSDDERSDQGAPTGFRKPPLPLQPVQRKLVDTSNLPSPDSKLAGGFNLPSPDSVASDSSIASATSLLKQTVYQEPTHVATSENRANLVDPKGNISDPSSQIQMQQFHDSAYMLPPQQIQQHQQQQQFVPASTHYIHHPATGQAPFSSFYQMYAPPSQQQLHHQIDQQYPMYFLPVTQLYNLPMQSNTADATVVASSRPLAPPNSTIVAPSAATATKPEMAGNVYRTAAIAIPPPLVQVPSNQFQQQFMGVPQMHHPSNYGFE